MKPVLVGVLTPCYNGARYLESCIESVLAQDYPHFEMIVQDGDSRDGTVDILKRYGDRIRWVSEKDGGQSDGLNRALQRCRGDIIGVLNADDEYLPHAFSWAVEQFSRDSQSAVIYGRQFNIDANGRVLGQSPNLQSYDFARMFCCEEVIPAQAAFIRRNALEMAGFYVDATRRTCPDYELCVRLGLRFPMKYVPELVARYRQHAGSEGQRPDVIHRMVRSKCQVVRRVCRDPEVPGAIRALKKRAYSGIYRWSASHFLGIPAPGMKQTARRQLLKSFWHKPSFPSFHYTVFLSEWDWKETVRVFERILRENGRRVDRFLLGGLFYRFVYLRIKKPVKDFVVRTARTARWRWKKWKRDSKRRAVKRERERQRERRRRLELEREWFCRSQLPYGNGFHGDRCLAELVDFFLKQSRYFVETGTYLGHTAFYVGKRYRSLPVHSCDIDGDFVRFARSKTKRFRHVRIAQMNSPEFLRHLLERRPRLKDSQGTFWIDSHWGSYWPLQDEIRYLLSTLRKGFILIDDFKIPDRPEYAYDRYNGQDCSLELILPLLPPGRCYPFVFPKYSQSAAQFLPRDQKPVGICVIIVGMDSFVLPKSLEEYFRVEMLEAPVLCSSP